MKLTILTEDQAYDHLGNPHNPPSIASDFSERDFEEEWLTARDGLDDILRRFGENDAYGTKDYNLGDTVMLSRGIGLEVTSEKMLTLDFVPELQRYLVSLPHDYEIDLALMTDDGQYHVFVGRDEVRAWCPEIILNKLVPSSASKP